MMQRGRRKQWRFHLFCICSAFIMRRYDDICEHRPSGGDEYDDDIMSDALRMNVVPSGRDGCGLAAIIARVNVANEWRMAMP